MICHRSVKRAMVFLIYNYKAGAKWRTCPSPLPLCKRKEQMQLQLVKHVDNHPGCGMWRLSQLNKEVGFVVWISEMVDHLNLLDLVFIWQVAFHLFWDASQQEMTRSMPNYLFQKEYRRIYTQRKDNSFFGSNIRKSLLIHKTTGSKYNVHIYSHPFRSTEGHCRISTRSQAKSL